MSFPKQNNFLLKKKEILGFIWRLDSEIIFPEAISSKWNIQGF